MTEVTGIPNPDRQFSSKVSDWFIWVAVLKSLESLIMSKMVKNKGKVGESVCHTLPIQLIIPPISIRHLWQMLEQWFVQKATSLLL